MPGRHSLTIQVDPSAIGHAAVVVNTPSEQTYAGFGPRDKGPPWFGTWSVGKFDVARFEASPADIG
jgi:hypothetical protein